jgi:hypothetical protein
VVGKKLKVRALCTRNTAIEAVLEACGRSFDPASMQVNKPTPVGRLIVLTLAGKD